MTRAQKRPAPSGATACGSLTAFLALFQSTQSAPAPDPPEVAAIEQAVRAGESLKAFELGKLGAQALPALRRILADQTLPDPARYMAANGLGATRLPAAVEPLLGVLDDPSFNVRRCAAEALGQLQARAAIPRLRTMAAEDPFVWRDTQAGVRRWLVRESAVKALQALGETPPASAPAPPSWVQPPIVTGTPFSDTIPWAATLEAAFDRARRERKPVLATVVALGDVRWSSGWQGAADQIRDLEPPVFGDERAAQIDEGLVKERALMATLFTDPDVVQVITAHFVPVRLRVHTYAFDRHTWRKESDPLVQLGTSGPECQAPALVFADAGGKLLHACRRMGVFHAPLLRAMLRSVLAKAGGPEVPAWQAEPLPALDQAWEAFRSGAAPRARELLATVPAQSRGFEAAFLRGLVADALGDATAASEAWTAARKGDPHGPWGSRAALCLLPRGLVFPEWESLVVPGFDPLAPTTERRLPEKALPEVLAGAVAWLVRQQRADGGWRDPFVDPHPMAGPGSPFDLTVPRTALAVRALLASAPHAADQRAAIETAVARGTERVGVFADAPAGHIWHLTYALELQLELLRRKHGDQKLAQARAQRLVAALATEQKQGGWSYVPPPRIHSFNTALVLRLLPELRSLGVPVEPAMVADAVRLLESLRSKEDAREFRYAVNVDHHSVKASACRTTLCELALLASDTKHDPKHDPGRLRAALDLFLQHEPEVRSTTKVFESYFAVGPLHDAYHYYFGHAYTALALAHLPAEEARALAARQRDVLLGQVELDGSFVDAQMQGKAASTALALLTLVTDLEQLRR